MRFAYCAFLGVLLAACSAHGTGSDSLVPPTASSKDLASSVVPLAPNSNPFCSRLGTQIGVTQAVWNYCKGPIGSPGTFTGSRVFGTNVDAADPREDFGLGQSNPSVAAAGPYVVTAWNDATAFFASCPSMNFKEEFASVGFSNNGGSAFTDMGGLGNIHCSQNRLWDPSVAAWTKNGTPYFYIGFLQLGNGGIGQNGFGIETCHIASGHLQCSTPIVPFTTLCGSGTPKFCDLLDKDALTIDAVRGRLYATLTTFNHTTGLSKVDAIACALTNPATPNCTTAVEVPAPADSCENTGPYPAVDMATGNVYVAYEHNWPTKLYVGECRPKPVSLVVTRYDSGLHFLNGVTFSIISLSNYALPGYTGQLLNDFPQVAVSDASATVSIVWNDARLHPYGDILLWSLNTGLTTTKTSAPIRINTQTTGSHFMPSLSQDNDGDLSVTFFQRANATTSLTDLFAAIDVNPLITMTPLTNIKISSGSSSWSSGMSNLRDRWGDYTDSSINGNTLYITWADGRLGVPQPFVAKTPVQ